MAAVASHLADTSALARLRHEPVAMVLGPLIEAGLVATCGVIEFELGWATRTSAEFDELRADRDTGYEWLATHDEDWRRALDVQATLWRDGQIRAVGFPDLLIAAVAEREQVTVLHYDSDEDHRTASAMGRPLRDRPVATPHEPHPRRTSVLACRLTRDRPVPTEPSRRLGPALAFLRSAGSDLSKGGSAGPLAPQMAHCHRS